MSVPSIAHSKGGQVIVDGLYKSYGDEFTSRMVIEDCSLTAQRGRFTILVGPSGCGKTTLINLIAGYERPTRGRITVDGTDVAAPDSDRLVVFQETALFPWMNVLENVMYGPSVQRKMPAAQAEVESAALLARVGLLEFRDKYPNQLSGGMQRRAELARALINKPSVLLMDEPFRGLDAMTRQLMQEYLMQLFEANTPTILFVTSEIDEAILLADTLIVLSRSPASTKSVFAVDFPRPRGIGIFKSPRYAELKADILGSLYEEAVGAFSSTSSSKCRNGGSLRVAAFEGPAVKRLAAIALQFALALAPATAPTHAAQSDQSSLTPIIAELFAQPSAFAGKSITIYGLVVEADRSRTRFMLQDVSQQPLRIIGNEQLKAKIGDQLIVIGTLRVSGKEIYVVARALMATHVLGGGGCC